MYLSLCVIIYFLGASFHGFREIQYKFPFICSNIPGAPAYGIYLSQLI